MYSIYNCKLTEIVKEMYSLFTTWTYIYSIFFYQFPVFDQIVKWLSEIYHLVSLFWVILIHIKSHIFKYLIQTKHSSVQFFSTQSVCIPIHYLWVSQCWFAFCRLCPRMASQWKWRLQFMWHPLMVSTFWTP